MSIFLISHSDWEVNYPVKYAQTREEAEKWVNDENIIQRRVYNLCEEINTLVDLEREEIPYISTLEVPKWKAGLGKDDITDEMREERDTIITKNVEIAEKNNKIQLEVREKQRKSFRDNFEKMVDSGLIFNDEFEDRIDLNNEIIKRIRAINNNKKTYGRFPSSVKDYFIEKIEEV